MEEVQAEEEPVAPALTERARKALGATRNWARFAGFVLFCIVPFTLVRNGVHFSGVLHKFHAGLISHKEWVGVATGLVVSTLWIVVFYSALGWLALRYAGNLESIHILEKPNSEDITSALGAQRSYWRLQAVLIIAAIVLLVLAVIFAVAVGVLARR